MATLTESTLRLWIYQGSINSYILSEPEYTITKTKLSDEDTILFEIGELVKDYIEVSFDGNYDTAVNSAWASYTVTNTFDKGLATEVLSTHTGTLLATHGYGYFEDEINPQNTSGLQQTNTSIFWKKGERVRVPVYSGRELYDIEWYEGQTIIGNKTFGKNIEAATADTEDYKADHSGQLELSADKTHFGNTKNTEFLKYSVSPYGADKAILRLRDGTTVTVTVTYIEECRNDSFKVTFLNKFGAFQDIWMFGRRKEVANASREILRLNTINSSTTSTNFATYTPTDTIFNVEAEKSLVLNTGYVSEQYSQVIQELMISEHVYIHEDNNVFPISPTDNSFEYKTHLYDRLINYTVRFDYGYSEINLVR